MEDGLRRTTSRDIMCESMSPGGHKHRGNAAGVEVCVRCQRCEQIFGPVGEWPSRCADAGCNGTDEAGDLDEVPCPKVPKTSP